MTITPKQFESILKSVLADELPKHLKPLEDKIVNLSGDVGELSAKLDSYISKEWNVHIHDAHPRLEKRLKAIEQKVGIKAA